MVHVPRKSIWEEQKLLANVKIGDWVEVAYDYLPDTCSDGGIGVITALINVSDDPEIRIPDELYATVRYVIGNRVEHSVEMKRLTVVPMPFKGTCVNLRKKHASPAQVSTAPKPSIVKRTPFEWLKLGLSSRRHEKKGWLRQQLIENNELHPSDEEMLWKRVISDFKCQESYREGMKAVMGSTFTDPRDYKGVIGKNSGGKFVSLKTASQEGVPKNIHTLGYLFYAYGVSETTFFRKRDAFTCVTLPKEQGKGLYKDMTAIDNRSIAREFYTPRFFYAREKAMGEEILSDAKGAPLDGWGSYQRRFGHWGKD